MHICQRPGLLPPLTLAFLPEKHKDESLFGVVMSSEIWKSENRIASTPDKGKPHESHPRNVT